MGRTSIAITDSSDGAIPASAVPAAEPVSQGDPDMAPEPDLPNRPKSSGEASAPVDPWRLQSVRPHRARVVSPMAGIDGDAVDL